MECPKCQYALSPFDVDCPRCKKFAELGIAVPTLSSPANPVEADAALPSAANEVSVSTQSAVSTELWYSKLDLMDEGAATEDATPSRGENVASEKLAVPQSSGTVSASPAPKVVREPISPSRVKSTMSAKGSNTQIKPVEVLPPAALLPKERQGLGKNHLFVLGSFVIVSGIVWFAIHAGAASHNQHAKAGRILAEAKELVAQANVTTAQFQQVDFTPEAANNFLRLRTLQYQKAAQLCQSVKSPDTMQTATSVEAAAARGLYEVQADTKAQTARALTAQVAEEIAHYKRLTLTDQQAASIRAELRAKCQSALNDCTQSLQTDPANAVAHAERVRALRYLGDAKSADASLTDALQVCPSNPILLSLKGK